MVDAAPAHHSRVSTERMDGPSSGEGGICSSSEDKNPSLVSDTLKPDFFPMKWVPDKPSASLQLRGGSEEER